MTLTGSLDGRVVFITGASSGFGADSARLFAAEGCSVILTARRMERLEKLAQEIRADGGKADAYPLDVTDKKQITHAVQNTLRSCGRIDILYNNAGYGRLNWLDKLDPQEDIDDCINVNLRGLMQVTRAVLPYMIKQRSGCVINMSSIAGFIAPPLYTLYSATKFGVRGFNDALRREVAAYGIHVCGIYPGPAVTEFSQRSGENRAKQKLGSLRFLYLDSKHVARNVIDLARHPRRTLVIPWWFHPVISLDYHFPGIVDWLMKAVFLKLMQGPDN